jgi:hypothetical protein
MSNRTIQVIILAKRINLKITTDRQASFSRSKSW